ncbi:MAG: PKD domain-containing protein [Planctomycetota bacterium]
MTPRTPITPRRREARSLRLAAVLAVWLGWVAVASAAHPWWDAKWKHRRKVTVENPKPTLLEGEDFAVAEVYTAGKAAGDGSDIRVTTVHRRVVPSRVLMTGPGDRAVVAFAIRPKVQTYYVYFGNRKPPKPDETLEIKRGVLMETWKYPGGQAGNLKQARRVLGEAKTLLGRDVRDRLFIGHNPFGPQAAVASRFTGWLMCPVKGEYLFSISSSNASFLLIDDVLLISNGGWHGPQRDIRKRDRVQLTAGLHKVTFLHVSPAGTPVAVLAWKPPGQKRVTYIPPAAFAPFHQATPGLMETLGDSETVDFIPTHAGETFMKNRYYQRYVFEGLKDGKSVYRKTLHWDFGDGQTATGDKPEHVYLTPGMHKVTVSAETHLGKRTRTHRVFVSRPWDRVTSNKLDAVREYAKLVAEYDFAKLPPRANAEAMLLLARGKQSEALLSAGSALLRRDKAPGIVLPDAMEPYVELLSARGKDLDAAGDLLTGAKIATTPDASARLMVDAAGILLRHGKTTESLQIFEAVVRKYATLTTAPAIREARIGIGDVWRAGGDAGKAAAAYDKAGDKPYHEQKKPAVEKGDFARHVEAYLRKRNYDDAETYLKRWAMAYPGDKLDGYWSLMAARLYVGRKQYDRAVLEAEILARVSPRSNHVPQLLMLAAEAYLAIEASDKAAATWKRVVKDYAESPLALKASEKLQK